MKVFASAVSFFSRGIRCGRWYHTHIACLYSWLLPCSRVGDLWIWYMGIGGFLHWFLLVGDERCGLDSKMIIMSNKGEPA